MSGSSQEENYQKSVSRVVTTKGSRQESWDVLPPSALEALKTHDLVSITEEYKLVINNVE